MVKESLGKNIVFVNAALRDPQFASRDSTLPFGISMQAKCAGKPKVMLRVVLSCDEGVFLVRGDCRVSEFTFDVELKHDEKYGFYVTFEVGSMEPPKAHLATAIVNYLVPDNPNPVWNDCFDLEVNVVKNPALVGVKNDDYFEELKELEIDEASTV